MGAGRAVAVATRLNRRHVQRLRCPDYGRGPRNRPRNRPGLCTRGGASGAFGRGPGGPSGGLRAGELQELGLAGWPKTSGGQGLHLLVPLEPGRYTHTQVRTWAKALAARLAERSGGLLRLPHGATHRGRGVFVDYAQNGYGRNTAAPYSLRARPGAPVSTPLGWDEVEAGGFKPTDFNLETVPERIRRQGDLLAGMREAAFRLPEL